MSRSNNYRDYSPQRWKAVQEAIKDWPRTIRFILILLVMTACTVVIMRFASVEVSHVVAAAQHHLPRRVVQHHLPRRLMRA
jgi:hypothetical protein